MKRALTSMMVSSLAGATSIRNGTADNCVGIRSCRPRCLGFYVDRFQSTCTRDGVFADQDNAAAWNSTLIQACHSSTKCNTTAKDELCSDPWKRDLSVDISEHSISTIFQLSSSTNRFTFCSISPCPKHECALPEQLVRSKINFVHSSSFALTHHSSLSHSETRSM